MSNKFYSKVFFWLFIGLLVTFASGYIVITNSTLQNFILNTIAYLLIFIAQIVLCLFLVGRINKMSATTAKVLYLGYAVLTGFTLSTIFLMFTLTSIIYVLIITAVLFGIFALIGKYTKIDLSRISTFLFIGLLAVIILEFVNMFIMNESLDITLCIVSILVFLGYVAWDMQRIKYMSDSNNDNLAIFGAFQLYLDFVNIFLDLLRLFGDNNRD